VSGRVGLWVLLVALLAAHLGLQPGVNRARKSLPQATAASYLLPPPLARVLALEYDGLVADATMLKGMAFIGSTAERNERPRVRPEEWRWLYELLRVTSTLDPYFQDPYYFANSFLPWDAKMASETNLLLDQGIRYRSWDYLPPYLAGFNSFYFLHDNARASEYLAEAMRRPGASPSLASLASRLAYQANRTESAISFLEEMLQETRDPPTRKEYETRILALRAVLSLENAVQEYRQKFGAPPTGLRQLLEERVIARLPRDPYGGEFYLDADGSIKTTSDLREMAKKP
jgi:hypothetical protein